jgi:choline dehydrogenase-like flavoprotein
MSVPDEIADVVIVGSGVAGALCAYRLAQAGVRVLMLEAGPRIERADIIQAFQTSPHFDYSSGYPNPDWAPRPDWGNPADDYIEQRGAWVNRMEYLRVVGGTTWHWGGSTQRMRPEDFRLASLHQRGIDWPLSYDALEPDYADAERELGVAGDAAADPGLPRSTPYPMPPVPGSYAENYLSERLRALGLTFMLRPAARNTRAHDGRSPCQGFGTCAPICPSGAQYSAMVHIDKAERLGARVLENCRVDRLTTDAAGNITYANFTRADGRSGRARGRLFAVAANGIETPRLLLMSASDSYPGGLANRSGQVGRNFMDHPGLLLQMSLPDPVYSGRGPVSTRVSVDFSEGPFRQQHAAWQLDTTNILDVHAESLKLLAGALSPPQLDQVLRERLLRQCRIVAHLEQLPDPANRVVLHPSRRDRAGQPAIQLHYSIGDYEQAGMVQLRALFARIGRHLGATEAEVSGPQGHHHLMGTTRMGHDPRDSVTDSHGRTHDHANLFVLGSSLFPTGGTANPTLTIAALALRTARAMQAQLRRR